MTDSVFKPFETIRYKGETAEGPLAYRWYDAGRVVSHHALGGANYVLWGGREGYETLLNTDMKQELQHLGRFLNLVVE